MMRKVWLRTTGSTIRTTWSVTFVKIIDLFIALLVRRFMVCYDVLARCHGLDRGSANSFCKGPGRNIFRLGGPGSKLEDIYMGNSTRRATKRNGFNIFVLGSDIFT